MNIIEIFDPAMCCPTGLCGPNINPDLLRISVVIEALRRMGVEVKRHNLRDEPALYMDNKTVNALLNSHGADVLPITLVNGEVALTKVYPSTRQMSEWSGKNLDFIPVK